MLMEATLLLEQQAARIEELEAALRTFVKYAPDDRVALTTRISVLEAALRACVQYHVKAAADCRAISAVNQNNDLGEDSLTAAIDHEIAADDIGEIVRAALAPEQDK
jgi:hypothetical protein